LALGWIGQLYEIEDGASDDLEHRAELRRTDAPAVLQKLKTWLCSANSATGRRARPRLSPRRQIQARARAGALP
jgi:hypothetical protein